MKNSDVQQAVSDFASFVQGLLAKYATNGQYPINSAIEIRVTALDDPSLVPTLNAESPVISALSMDQVAKKNSWDVALWLDVLTIPDTANSNQFYADFETWLLNRFSGSSALVLPEWSKGLGLHRRPGALDQCPVFQPHTRCLYRGPGWR